MRRLSLSVLLLLLLLILPAGVRAGGARVPLPGVEAWSAPNAGFEEPGSCEGCEGVRAFAVLGGEGWFLLRQEIVGAKGRRVPLPARGVDLAAGLGVDETEAKVPQLWVLTFEERGLIVEGIYASMEREGLGPPVAIAGDGTTRSLEQIGDEAPKAKGQSHWGAGKLFIRSLPDQSWELRFGSLTVKAPALPAQRVVDVAVAGTLPDGRTVLSFIDSKDGSAATGVRFFAINEKGLSLLASGPANGDLNLTMRRSYAVDPVDGGIYTLMVHKGRLSLRRYPAGKKGR